MIVTKCDVCGRELEEGELKSVSLFEFRTFV